MRDTLTLLRDALVHWYASGAESMAAAVSYYAMFAVVPLIFISVYFVSLLFGEELVREVMLTWGSGLGTAILSLLETAVAGLPHSPLLTLAPFGTTLFLLVAIVVFFNTLTEGFHALFGVSSSGLRGLARKSLRAIRAVFLLQVFIIGMIAAEFGFAIIFDGFVARSYALTLMYTCSLFVLFTLCYSMLPLQNVPSLRSRIYGAAVAAVLFSITKTTVSVHIAMTPVPDLFGAAGVALALLLWMYVSASIIYYGASIAHLHDLRRTHRVSPDGELPL